MDKALRQRLQELEEELLQNDTRSNRERLEALLHPEFREFGSSGRAYDRAAIVQALVAEMNVKLRLEQFGAQKLAEGVVLVTYRSCRTDAGGAERAALRSSLWVRVGAGWQMIFHQGTIVGSAVLGGGGGPADKS